MDLITPTSADWPERMLLRYGLASPARLRERAESLKNPRNREWVVRLAERIESMGLGCLAEVPNEQLALITAE
ncbi:hypothetical protein [Pseudolysinimonas sp.]